MRQGVRSRNYLFDESHQSTRHVRKTAHGVAGSFGSVSEFPREDVARKQQARCSFLLAVNKSTNCNLKTLITRNKG